MKIPREEDKTLSKHCCGGKNVDVKHGESEREDMGVVGIT